jgi:hypothetical protein
MKSAYINTKPTILDIANQEIRAHQKFKNAYLTMVRSRSWYNDYFVTLTFKYGYKNDEAKRTADLIRYFNMLDRALLGKESKKGKRKLFRYTVFELNKGGQLHVHFLLENPGSVNVNESAHKRLIISTWLKLDCSGSEVGNKVLSINKTPEIVEEYIHKHLRVSNSLMADPTLWHLPTTQPSVMRCIESQ